MLSTPEFISRVWKYLPPPLTIVVLLAACTTVLVSGFYHSLLPGSQTVTRSGSFGAYVLTALACCAILVATGSIWRFFKPRLPISYLAIRTLLSILIAALICLHPLINRCCIYLAITGPAIRGVRAGLFVLVFVFAQLMAYWQFDRSARRCVSRFGHNRGDVTNWREVLAVGTVVVLFWEVCTQSSGFLLQISPLAILLNAVILSALVCVLWSVSNRGLLSLGTVLLCYSVLCCINATKLKFLQTSIQLGDESYLTELLLFDKYLNMRMFAFVGCLLLGMMLFVWWLLKNSRLRLGYPARLKLFLFGTSLFASILVLPWLPSSKSALANVGIKEDPLNSELSSRNNGLLCDLVLQWESSSLSIPPGYDQASIARILNEKSRSQDSSPSTVAAQVTDRPVSIIVFLFESLMDPQDLEVQLNRPVLPNFEKLKATGKFGFAISPRLVSGSAETEFELLTGMSSGFLPPNTCTYKHFLNHPTSSMISLLRSKGRHATVIQVVPPSYFNYEETYRNLGFDRFISKADLLNPEMVSEGFYVSDRTLVNEMIRALDHAPFYVQGFNLASHGPYTDNAIREQPRFLSGPPTAANEEIETYLQVLARTDKEIGRLIQELERREDRVLLLVSGDHHPPLSADCGVYHGPAFTDPGPKGQLHRHRVPYVIWKNFDDVPVVNDPSIDSISEKYFSPKYVSMNFLSLLLLREAGIQPTGLMAWNQQLFEQCPVVSRNLFYTDGQAKSWDELSPDLQQRIREYELLQYDILLGENYSAEIWAKNATLAEPNRPAAAEKAVP